MVPTLAISCDDLIGGPRGRGNCALLEVHFCNGFLFSARFLFSAQKFYLRTLTKNFSLRESSVFRPKVLFGNFGQKIFPPRKFGFAPKSSICELWPTHTPSAKVRFCAQKFYSRTFAFFKSAKVRKKNFWSKFFSYGSKFAKVRSSPPP